MPEAEKKFVCLNGLRFEATEKGLFYVPDETGRAKKHECPDCHFCQWCAQARCRLCRKEPSDTDLHR